MSDETCHIANGGCKKPAGWGIPGQGRFAVNESKARIGKCAECGEPVCSNPHCSKRVMVKGERHRVCAWCIGDLKDD